jgi:hypothetical protein
MRIEFWRKTATSTRPAGTGLFKVKNSMTNARVMAGCVWFVAWCAFQACGGGADAGDDGNAPAPNATATLPADQATGAAACVAASCATLQLFGSAAPGCCQATGECGGSIVYMGTPYCAPPNIEQLAAQIAAPLEQLEEEAIVTADECPGMTFQGAAIAGCCDRTGVCGVSTESFASTNPDSSLPLDIPVTCISEAEAMAIGMVPAEQGQASEPVACSAGGN